MMIDLHAIPGIILAACGLLILFFLFCMRRLLQESNVAVRQCEKFAQELRQLRPQTGVNRRDGMQLTDLEQLRSASQHWTPRQRVWWANLEGAMEPYTRPDGNPGWFLTTEVENVLSWNEVIERDYHASFHDSVPGILTGLGLLATFISILVALQGVRVDMKGTAETVSGIGNLINGLSGKFLSSIVALFLSVTYTLSEKRWGEGRLIRAHGALIEQAREVFPTLTASRVLVDLEAISLQQLTLIRSLYAEVTERLPLPPPPADEEPLELPALVEPKPIFEVDEAE